MSRGIKSREEIWKIALSARFVSIEQLADGELQSARKQLIPSRSDSVRVIRSAISKKQYPRRSYRCWFGTYGRRGPRASQRLKSNPSRRRAVYRSMCVEKKSYWTCGARPAAHFAASVRDRKKNESIIRPLTYFNPRRSALFFVRDPKSCIYGESTKGIFLSFSRLLDFYFISFKADIYLFIFLGYLRYRYILGKFLWSALGVCTGPLLYVSFVAWTLIPRRAQWDTI